MPKQADNILFIFTDQWRSDCMGYHHHPVVKTPHLDALAQMSTDFINATSIVPLCTPARGCIMSGLLPHESGVIDNCDVGATSQEYMLADTHTWLDAAADAGYQTAYYGKWHLGPAWPEHHGNISFDLCRKNEWNKEKHALGAQEPAVTIRGQLRPEHPIQPAVEQDGNYPPFYEKLDAVAQRHEDTVRQRAIDFLQEKGDDAPWCLTASFVGPHFPSSLPEPYWSMYPAEEMQLPANHIDKFINKPWFQGRNWWPSVYADTLTEQQWKKIIAAYYGCITMMDDMIGEVLEAAKQHSGGRPTRVIFTADHGEMLASHGKFDKHAYFYEEVIRTPLLICPDLNANLPAATRREFVNTQDIAQTFYDLCGEAYGGGRSLFPLAQDNLPRDWEKYAFSNYYKYNGHSFELRCVKNERYKYVWCPQDIDELYDLENDPGELFNLSDSRAHQTVLQELKEVLHRRLLATNDSLLEDASSLPPAGSCGAPAYPEMHARL